MNATKEVKNIISDVQRTKPAKGIKHAMRAVLPTKGTKKDAKRDTRVAALLTHMKDAHAMEMHALDTTRSLATTTDDPALKAHLEQHVEETKTHAERLANRLKAYGEKPTGRRMLRLRAATLGKGLTDKRRGEKPFTSARDAYTAEHLEIAAYEVLERLANRAGDAGTADVARRNRADDAAMADYIAHHWDRVVEFMVGGKAAKKAAKAEARRAKDGKKLKGAIGAT